MELPVAKLQENAVLPTRAHEGGGQGFVGGLAAREVQLATVEVHRAAGGPTEPGGARAAVGGEDLEDAGGGEVLERAVERHSDPGPSNSGLVPMQTRRPDPPRLEAFGLRARTPGRACIAAIELVTPHR